MKKVWSVVCVCAMVIGMLPAMALTASAYRSIFNGFYYERYTDGTVSIEGYYTQVTDLTIPSSLDGHTVTSIGGKAFQDWTKLESVTFPDTLTDVSNNAFKGCTSLKSVTLPDSAKNYGASAFEGCTSLETVNLPKRVSVMGAYAFAGCTSLKSVQVPYIDGYFGTGIFSGCTALENVTILNGRYLVMEYMFSYCTSLKKIKLPTSVTTIGVCAFEGCSSLESIVIPKGVKVIHEAAFERCTSLKNVFYRGTRSQWESIDIRLFNINVITPNVYCNYTEPKVIDASATGSYASDNAYASVKVTASGTGVTYAWYVKDPGDDRYFKSSITSNTYKAKMTSDTAGRLAYCIVTDKYGAQVRSKTFVLRRKATITSVPATVAYAKKNAKVSIKIGAVGDGLKYTWYTRDDGDSKYYKSSVTSSTYTTKITSSSKNRLVYCVVKDKYGKTAQTKKFLLRESVSIVSQPKTGYAWRGMPAKTTVKASGDGLKYTWYIKDTGETVYTKSSVTKASYSTTMNNNTNNRLLYCVIKDKYGNTVKSATAQLKMK